MKQNHSFRVDAGLERVAKANGFSLHAGVSCEGHQREKVKAGTAREAALGYKRDCPGGVPLHAVVQEWTDMNGFFTDAGKIAAVRRPGR
jgi:hypothetical protein